MRWIRIKNALLDVNRIQYFSKVDLEKDCYLRANMNSVEALDFAFDSKDERDKEFEKLCEILNKQ